MPPIIKLCQFTQQSQLAVPHLFWFIAALGGLYRAETLVGSILFGGLSLVMMVTASLRVDSPVGSVPTCHDADLYRRAEHAHRTDR